MTFGDIEDHDTDNAWLVVSDSYWCWFNWFRRVDGWWLMVGGVMVMGGWWLVGISYLPVMNLQKMSDWYWQNHVGEMVGPCRAQDTSFQQETVFAASHRENSGGSWPRRMSRSNNLTLVPRLLWTSLLMFWGDTAVDTCHSFVVAEYQQRGQGSVDRSEWLITK